jgi:hypothetical protein
VADSFRLSCTAREKDTLDASFLARGGWAGRQLKERQIRLMTNSHKSQSEKLAAGGGRETAAKKPHNKKVPGPHH